MVCDRCEKQGDCCGVIARLKYDESDCSDDATYNDIR